MAKETIRVFQQSWSKNKYWVMARSQQSYNDIRELAKGNLITEEKLQEYQKILLNLETLAPTTKTLRVAYQHIWGYFKKQATDEEKQVYKNSIMKSNLNDGQLENFLKELTIKYQQNYLLGIRWCLTETIEEEQDD